MLSRREWLGRLLALMGLPLAARAHAAEAAGKISKAAAKYQDTPNNGQSCGTCKFYIAPGGRAGGGMMGRGHMGGKMGPGMMGGQSGHMGSMMAPGTCQVVEGSISPTGWCVLYQQLS